MTDIPSELQYSKNHEWVRNEKESIVSIGITDHAQCQLGDLVFVDLPEIGTHFNQGDEVAVVESVKTAADVYCPLAGEVIEVNQALVDHPELINQDCYSSGWIFKLKVAGDTDHLTNLLNAENYAAQISEE